MYRLLCCWWKRFLLERRWCASESSFDKFRSCISIIKGIYAINDPILYAKRDNGKMCTISAVWWRTLQGDFFIVLIIVLHIWIMKFAHLSLFVVLTVDLLAISLLRRGHIWLREQFHQLVIVSLWHLCFFDHIPLIAD